MSKVTQKMVTTSVALGAADWCTTAIQSASSNVATKFVCMVSMVLKGQNPLNEITTHTNVIFFTQPVFVASLLPTSHLGPAMNMTNL
jgi:hypothetical protein